ADKYIVTFKELAFQTKYNSIALIKQFQQGLHQSLLDKIYALPEMPKKLKDWYKYALRFDQQWQKL
ncbi:hypothetical protein DACRYDRAFT_37335, partial [Dacryopinax primogenitus]